MGRDLDATVAEALELAAHRGGLLSALTLAVPFPSPVVRGRVQRQLERAGLPAVEVMLQEAAGPPRIIAVEVAARR